MNFNQKVCQICKKIPCGKVSTYQAIAHKLKTKAYRAVGNALNKNKNKDVPCHRVVKSNGQVGGFVYGTKKKTARLRKEGVIVVNNKVDLKKFLF